jgi:peptidoglycan/LPS O-acetylase OafA/YrhL
VVIWGAGGLSRGADGLPCPATCTVTQITARRGKAMPSIGTTFDPRRNSLNALRLALAASVIVSHSWPIGGYGLDPGYSPTGRSDQDLGSWAVAGFFAISGFLIAGSRINSRSPLDYYWRRVLRIYPAFIACLLLVAFVIAPLATGLLGGGRYALSGAASYVLNNLGLLIQQFGIPKTLATVPFPGAWDGALWTLFFEFLCYIGIGLLVSVVPRRYLTASVVIVFVGCIGITFAVTIGGLTIRGQIEQLARLGGFFAAGAMFYLQQRRIPQHASFAVGSALAIALTILTGTFQAFSGLFVVYLLLYLGIRLPLHRIGAQNDISYGMYIYAFPIQQVLQLEFPGQRLPVLVFVLLSVILTVPLAAASWFLVEKPAMTLKRLTEPRSTGELWSR